MNYLTVYERWSPPYLRGFGLYIFYQETGETGREFDGEADGTNELSIAVLDLQLDCM